MSASSDQPLPPVALTIAGSDNSAGAGIQADLKTFSAYGVYGLTAVTCVVAEIPGRVSAIQPVALDIVRQQIELSLGAYPVVAAKTGMLRSREIIEMIASLYGELPATAITLTNVGGSANANGSRTRPLLVVDPVMVASSGDSLLGPDALAAYQGKLFPLATLITPNLDEARVLLGGRRIEDPKAMQDAGAELCRRYGTAFLMKGGHLGGEMAIDLLCFPDGKMVEHHAPFIRGVQTHGTGCTYSAAITAGLAQGLDLESATARAKGYITGAVHGFFRWQGAGRNVDALNHWRKAEGRR